MEYGLIGEHLGHSYSPEIHARIGDYPYELKEIPRNELADFIKERSFKGINVTIPYKQDVIPLLDEVSESALSIGAVNTIVNKDGRLYGYNTDFLGMKAALNFGGISLEGRRVLILGTGGTSGTAMAVAKSLGAASSIKVSRTGNDGAITYEKAVTEHRDTEIILNTTPVGMYPNAGKSPVDISNFPELDGVMDVIYNPLYTELLLDARERDIPHVGGLYMLAAQAEYASALFFGREPDEELIEAVYFSLLSKKRNIALIGMSGSGKSAVGREIARVTGMELVDTDAEIVKRAGKPISDIFACEGEKAFRDMESEVIKELSDRTGFIISTGGGSVLRNENVRALRRGSVLAWLDRPPMKLTFSDDRPLAQSREAALRHYDERYEIYKAAADFRCINDTTIKNAAFAIIEGAN